MFIIKLVLAGFGIISWLLLCILIVFSLGSVSPEVQLQAQDVMVNLARLTLIGLVVFLLLPIFLRRKE